MEECDCEAQYCLRLIPLQICCKVIVIGDTLLHLLICSFFIKLAIFELIFVPFAVAQLMLTMLSVLFYVGMVRESEKLMIPMIVAKIIMMLIVGTVTILTWIALALSLFLLIHLESPIKGLSTSTYLALQSVAMLICLTLLLVEGSVLQDSYKHIKRKTDHRNIDEEFLPFVNGGSTTMKPTAL
ncbi:unnamed protein product [Litomosoides sigmodontis]|uniref:Transmembrane protein n=1 Tax=Litomosoides sigmodontis TaxID=42156 RepID=A0A3P6SGL9_LITSI|nr:unnamed protein product [Litomosoides sigmodontis]